MKYSCPINLTLSVIGNKWKGLIIWALKDESKRFNEIRRDIGPINDKMLSQSLKKLAEQGILKRKSYNSIPPKVAYSLSLTGKQLIPIFTLMEEWGNTNTKGYDGFEYLKTSS